MNCVIARDATSVEMVILGAFAMGWCKTILCNTNAASVFVGKVVPIIESQFWTTLTIVACATRSNQMLRQMENPTVIRRRNQLARGLRWDVDVVKSQYVRPAGQNMIMVWVHKFHFHSINVQYILSKRIMGTTL
jgi:hypothetical protein